VRDFAPLAQLVEQLPLKEMVVGSNPTGRTSRVQSAGVAELVYAPALGADGATHGGSSPLPSTVDMTIYRLNTLIL
jgi:hypothetical protein